MKKLLFSIMLICAGIVQISAQEAKKDTSYWKKASSFGVNVNQGSFSNTWQGGALSNYAVGVTLLTKGEYTRDRTNWVNDFQFQYGMLKNKSQLAQKSLDRIFFDSKYGYKLKPDGKWYFTANFNVQSQVANGFDNANDKRPLISSFFTPAYVTEAIGFEYKPNKHFSLFLSPGAVRQTILGNKNLYQKNINNPKYKNYGVINGESVLNEIGIIQLVANYDKDIAQNINLKWRYQAFVSARDIKAVDNNLNLLVSAKVNQYVNVSIGAIVNYDQDQISELQWAQSLGIGLLYKW